MILAFQIDFDFIKEKKNVYFLTERQCILMGRAIQNIVL